MLFYSSMQHTLCLLKFISNPPTILIFNAKSGRMKNVKVLNLIALLAIVILYACNDNGTTLTPITDDDGGDFSYEIKNLRDTSVERTGITKYAILVNHTGGQSEKVVLSAEDLPKGMEVFFDPVNAEDAPFNTFINFKTIRAAEGVHKINIKAATPTTGVKSNSVNITVVPYSNAATGLVGAYNEQGSCTQKGSLDESVNIILDESGDNKIILKGLFSSVQTNRISATINPANKTLIIPSQLQNGVTYEGDGTYDDDKLVVNYTITGVAINESCTATLTRK